MGVVLGYQSGIEHEAMLRIRVESGSMSSMLNHGCQLRDV